MQAVVGCIPPVDDVRLDSSLRGRLYHDHIRVCMQNIARAHKSVRSRERATMQQCFRLTGLLLHSAWRWVALWVALVALLNRRRLLRYWLGIRSYIYVYREKVTYAHSKSLTEETG